MGKDRIVQTKKLKPSQIEFIKGENYCRWKGVLIGDTSFCSNLKGFIKDLQKIINEAKPLHAVNLIYGDLGQSDPVIKKEDLDWICDINKIRPYEDLKKVNLELLKDFEADLDKYFYREDYSKQQLLLCKKN